VLGGDPRVIANLFYVLAPTSILYPVVVISTVAAVIASQALISGGFSLAQQAMQLGYSPPLNIVHTSSVARGQIHVPEVPAEERVLVHQMGDGFYSVIARYGFIETPNVPKAIKGCRGQGLRVRMTDISYYLGRETLLTTGTGKLLGWRKSLFAFLSRNARPATMFVGIPPNRVVELGMQVQL
jgi:K+ transporter